MTTKQFPLVRAVLFDLDGTLIDSAPDLGAAADRLRTDRGLESLPLHAYRPLAGTGARGMLSVAFGITPEHPDFPGLREEFFSNYERCIHERTEVFAGVPELVATLTQQSMKWGVVTNKMTRFTSLIAQRVALFGDAGAIVSGDSTPYSKPHPAPLFAAAEQLGLEPHECIYVGDDERDIQAGRAAGMGTVAAMYGYLGTGAMPADWGADAMIYSPLDLLKLLKSH
ncbi:MAG TPA: HAD-IA family hydrolase [Alicycliphilus sp.]|jgi:phosphoglycolate phosphatase|nr:HAD-IA family hydrolase [Alicycliphilus sp.]MBP7330206.1 HAD-IA family hydrolase [Alicycliphilus sp.]MCA0441478.1 HAD-IA family hydrolase [Pseudomonadota bacterium]HRN65461.1 HAD-IA family hydrolase [Alicycliphilus sp.]